MSVIVKSGKRCVAFGCDNTHAHGVSLHSFPLNRPTLCKQWTTFVRKKRDKWSGPTKHSVLCSDHFTPESYPLKYRIMASMEQMTKRKTLNEDAVPTITMLSGLPLQSAGRSFDHSPPREKRRRTAFMKRENARIIEQYITQVDRETADENSDCQSTTVLPPSIACAQVFFNKILKCSTRSHNQELWHIMPHSSKEKSARIQVTPARADKACQMRSPKPQYRSIGVQCSLLRDDPSVVSKAPVDSESDMSDSSWESLDSTEDLKDQTYEQPNLDEWSDAESSFSTEEKKGMGPDRLFLVSESQLMILFQKCFECGKPACTSVTRVFGSMVKLQHDCALCGHSRSWNSQTMTGSIPTGNLRLSCGILFSGSLQKKALRVLQFMHVPVISTDTFLNHQRHYLQPAVLELWEKRRKVYIDKIVRDGTPICIGGDGRCDTPGHSAKFGSYSVMDLDQGVVIDIQLVQSNEVKSSCHMEKEGLIRSVRYLGLAGIEIGTIITDRHVQIVKWIRENMPETKHCIDVWHVAKGLKKKLFALSKEKECGELQKWIKSLTNHLYWTASSTPNGDRVLMLEKWNSITNHIVNIHEGHGSAFPRCEHADLTGEERRKCWLKPGSKCCEKLGDLISSRQMKKDIPMLSPHQQTSELEGYHSVINHFAPKMHGLSYNGMTCRLIIAALHYNENGRRKGAVTKLGQARYKIVYPKPKKGDYTIREVKTDATFVYVEDLVDCSVKMVHSTPMARSAKKMRPTPPALCSAYSRPIKEQAIAALRSRFAKY